MRRHATRISGSLPSPRAAIISLGCPKNLVDSEVLAGYLAEAGFALTGRPEEAQAIIVNTCSFIAPAVEEAKQTLREMARFKTQGNCQTLICAGCLPQREKASLPAEFPEVDAFLGVDEIPHIAEIVGAALCGRPTSGLAKEIRPPTYLYDHTTPRLLSTPPWTAYVKIAEGCHHRCSFCTIPALRGKFRSRQPDSVLKEVKELARCGVKEIILIAQDTTAYGRDLGTNLPSLLNLLRETEGLHWIRVMYSFPARISESLLETMAASEKICHYLDLPFQHSHPHILRLMNRAGSAEAYLKLIARLRSHLPDLSLRSSFIVGFPGETEKEFQDLLDFLLQAQLDRVGAFVYYREPETPAAHLENQVAPQIAQERYHRLMSVQQEVSLQRNRAWIGRKLEVLIEKAEGKRLLGRSFRDAPEIDGEVILERPTGKASPRPGDFVLAEITGASEYDLLGRICEVASCQRGRKAVSR